MRDAQCVAVDSSDHTTPPVFTTREAADSTVHEPLFEAAVRLPPNIIGSFSNAEVRRLGAGDPHRPVL